jgi:hypothetical protein
MASLYCTLIDRMFVPHALVLQQSIARHSPDALFAFYCTDDATARVLERYASPKVLVVAPRAFETERLRAARQGRKLNEYRWTCKPAVLLHAFASLPRLDWAGWVDADMLAFSDLDSALHQHPEASAILTPHAFSLPEFAKLEPAVGRFNAGYIAFRNNADGLAALNWWFERCLEGCPAQPMPGRFGDQKYLDVMAEMFPRVELRALERVRQGSRGLAGAGHDRWITARSLSLSRSEGHSQLALRPARRASAVA